jgi:hypothetical protein
MHPQQRWSSATAIVYYCALANFTKWPEVVGQVASEAAAAAEVEEEEVVDAVADAGAAPAAATIRAKMAKIFQSVR